MKHLHFYVFGLTLCIFAMVAQLSCVGGCERRFTETKHLSRHKKSCIYAQKQRQTALKARKNSDHIQDLLKEVPTLPDRKKRLQVRGLLLQKPWFF